MAHPDRRPDLLPGGQRHQRLRLRKAVEQGIVPESYRANAMRALQPVLDCIDEKGVVQQVSYGTPMGRESKDFYKQIPLHPMPYGQAMAILFLMEAEAQV